MKRITLVAVLLLAGCDDPGDPVSLSGDYNNCDSSCRDPAGLMVQMQGELLDKELGLLKKQQQGGCRVRGATHLGGTRGLRPAPCLRA